MGHVVLIPTDFSIESLHMAKFALEQSGDKPDLVFVHGIDLSYSITELLFFSKIRLLNALVSSDFRQACGVIRNKYSSRIGRIQLDVFTGNNRSAFNNFLNGNQITDICMPAHYQLKRIHPRSFDLLPFLRRSTLPIHEVTWEEKPHLPEKNKLAELFLL